VISQQANPVALATLCCRFDEQKNGQQVTCAFNAIARNHAAKRDEL
jgi:hypothetical protein